MKTSKKAAPKAAPKAAAKKARKAAPKKAETGVIDTCTEWLNRPMPNFSRGNALTLGMVTYGAVEFFSN